MNAEELSELLEKEKSTEATPTLTVRDPLENPQFYAREINGEWQIERDLYSRRQERDRYYSRTPHNPIDTIGAINQLMSSIRPGSAADLERIYVNLTDMSRHGSYAITDIHVERSPYSRGNILTIRLINGTQLVYDV